jgi:uncharacterized protein (PEP-CTERM system associated)
MPITRPLAALLAVAVLLAASPATAQFALGPLDEQGQGPVPPVTLPNQQQLRQEAPPAPDPNTGLPPKGPPMWLIVPRIDVSEEITDNARDAETGRQPDLITTVTPGIFISADGPRLTANLDYAPGIQRNLIATDQDQIVQNLFFNANGTLVPDAFNVETRGSIFESSRNGGLGGISPSQLTTGQRTETYAFEVSPVLQHHFDNVGDGELRYILGQTWFSDNTGAGDSTVDLPISAATHQELRGTLDTGDVGKYISNRVLLDGQRTDVDGEIGSNKQLLGTDEVQLRVRNNLALVLSGGWQVMQFEQDPAINLNEPTWYAGFIYEPNQDSSLELTYGHRDGANSFAGQMRYSITPLTTAYASYAETITTPQEAILGNLNNVALGPNGSLLNTQTGLPVSLNDNEVTLENDVERQRTFSASLVTELEPNRFTATFTHQNIESLTGAVPNDEVNGGIVTWDRALSPLNNLTGLVGYFQHDFEHSHTFNTSLQFRHDFSQTLFGAVTYSFSNVSQSPGGSNYFRNSLIFSIRKVF